MARKCHLSNKAATTRPRVSAFSASPLAATDIRAIAAAEARKTITDHYVGTRISAEWHIDRDLGRDVTQLGFLSALCLETAVPQGGLLQLELQDRCLTATARANIVRDELPIWSVLEDSTDDNTPEVGPPHVQFALLAQISLDRGITTSFSSSDGLARLDLTLPALQG